MITTYQPSTLLDSPAQTTAYGPASHARIAGIDEIDPTAPLDPLPDLFIGTRRSRSDDFKRAVSRMHRVGMRTFVCAVCGERFEKPANYHPREHIPMICGNACRAQYQRDYHRESRRLSKIAREQNQSW